VKKILSVVIIVLVISAAHAQKENPLKEGMPNTVKLQSGEVIYDLSGEWHAVYNGGILGSHEDIIKITQNDSQFSGNYLLFGEGTVGKHLEKIKGKISGNVIDEVFLHEISNRMTMNLTWIPANATISEDGNEIEITSILTGNGEMTFITLSLKRK